MKPMNAGMKRWRWLVSIILQQEAKTNDSDIIYWWIRTNLLWKKRSLFTTFCHISWEQNQVTFRDVIWITCDNIFDKNIFPRSHLLETMPSANSQTWMKSSEKVRIHLSLCPGKWSHVLWWIWTFELWLPQPGRRTDKQDRYFWKTQSEWRETN